MIDRTARNAAELLAAYYFWELEKLDPTGRFDMERAVMKIGSQFQKANVRFIYRLCSQFCITVSL